MITQHISMMLAAAPAVAAAPPPKAAKSAANAPMPQVHNYSPCLVDEYIKS
jgi:hypothetical protein